MTLTADQFARIGEKKIFMNSTYIMSRKWESNVFGLTEAEMTLIIAQFARIGKKKNF